MGTTIAAIMVQYRIYNHSVLAGLQSISADILEAVVDSATGIKIFILFCRIWKLCHCTVWGIVTALVFVEPMVMTGGGPNNAFLGH